MRRYKPALFFVSSPVLCAACLTRAATIYSSGGFEFPRFTNDFFNYNDPTVVGDLRGQDLGVSQWYEAIPSGVSDGGGNATGTAIVETKPDGSGSDLQDVLVTRTQYDVRWAPLVNYTPTSSLELVDISWSMLVNKTTTNASDVGPFFGIDANDSSSGTVKQIGDLGVDATTGKVLVLGSSGYTSTPGNAAVAFGAYNNFQLFLNYANDTYSAVVNGNLVDSGIPFVSSGISELTDADIAALQSGTATNSNQTGTAQFDNYVISSLASPPVSKWALSTGGSWSTAGNWTPNGVPGGSPTEILFGSGPGLAAPGNISLDGNRTVGQITFNSSKSYTIIQGAGGTLTIDDTADLIANNPAINVTNGSHAISAPVALANGLNVNFLNGSSLTVSNTISGSGPINVNGAGTFSIATTGVLPADSSLAISTGAEVALAACAAPSTPVIQTVASLSFDTTAGSKLDITNNELLITTTSPAAIRTGIIAGNIVSSLSNSSFGVGYISSGGGTEVRYTALGDTNLDGTVNFSDLLTLATNYGSTNGTWATGDFNYDGTVNFTDLLILAANYSSSLSPSQQDQLPQSIDALWNLALSEASSVPEPSTIIGCLMFVTAASLRRRRRQ